jgi:hypothetical protein
MFFSLFCFENSPFDMLEYIVHELADLSRLTRESVEINAGLEPPASQRCEGCHQWPKTDRSIRCRRCVGLRSLARLSRGRAR